MGTTTVTLAAGAPRPEFGINNVTELTADTNNITPNLGFSVDVSGTLSVQFRTDAALHNYPVVAALIYPCDVLRFDKTGSTGPTKIYIHRQGG